VTWRRVGAIYLVLAALAASFALVERTSLTVEQTADAPTVERSLLGAEPESVKAVTFWRDGERVSAEREGGRWRVLAPAGAEITPDLIAAAVATLTAGQVSEVMAEGPNVDLEAFGLAAPSSEVEVTIDGQPGAKVRVLLGSHNPTKTALYAKRDDAPTVYLVGLNLRYYQDLIFEAAAGAG